MWRDGRRWRVSISWYAIVVFVPCLAYVVSWIADSGLTAPSEAQVFCFDCKVQGLCMELYVSEREFQRTELRDKLTERVLQAHRRWKVGDPADVELWAVEPNRGSFFGLASG